jgi:Ca-activated chloride channel family protein
MLFAFRRGWIYVVFAGLLIPLPRADAFSWSDLWLRGDQRGARALASDDPLTAAKLIQDAELRAAASYRGGDYPGSAASLSGIDSVAANYNRGNALARSGQLQPAIEAYDRALEFEPGHADALYNRELVSELLEQQEQQQQEQEQSEEESGEQQSQAAADESEQGEQGEQSDQQSESSPSAAEQQADASDRPEQTDPTDDEQQQADAEPENNEPQPGDEEQNLQASALPQDIEEWASEQAADQWLRRIPQDPGGLLRRKFLYQYQRLGVDQDGNYVWPGDEAEPW